MERGCYVVLGKSFEGGRLGGMGWGDGAIMDGYGGIVCGGWWWMDGRNGGIG